ncbi:MAG: hypothetical protein KI792_14390 [Alphaproteobacteria bacterium]|nr:hypothetical protein [Alphaproteobacteria bacterium SS10]
MSKFRKGPIALAAIAGLTFGGSALASGPDAQQPTQTAAVTQTVEAPAQAHAQTAVRVHPDLLDDWAVDRPDIQEELVASLMPRHAIMGQYLDRGFTTEAAGALTRANNHGELPRALEGEAAGDWWQRAEPVLFEKMAEYKAQRDLPLQVAGGLAGLMALTMVGGAAAGAIRRRKDGPQATGEERLRQRFGGMTP